MTVYVDELRDWGASWGKSCHMYADTDQELYALMRQIYLPLTWLDRRHPYLIHVDLNTVWRRRAVAAGAEEVTNRFTGEFSLARRRAYRPAT